MNDIRNSAAETHQMLGKAKDATFELMDSVRIRSNCCLWSKPTSYSGIGRPKKHDKKFKVNDPSTWWSANETVEVNDPKLGKLRISQWKDLHFRTSASHDLSLIQVERLNFKGSGKKRRPLWLVWVGQQFLDLKDIWSQYARRFQVDHWYRFAPAETSLDFT